MKSPQRFQLSMVMPEDDVHRALMVERAVWELLDYATKCPPLDWSSLFVWVDAADDVPPASDIVRARIDQEGYAEVARDLYRERWGVDPGGRGR
jgi:hypothetical protein